MHIRFAAENCTSWFVAAADDDGGAQYSGCCSMVVDAAVAAGGKHEDSSAVLHQATQVEVVRAQDDCSFHNDDLCKFTDKYP